MNKLLTTIAIAILAIGGIAFAVNQSDSESSSEMKVAATIFPLYDITKEIAGDDFEVVLMLPAGASPHTFDPQPSLIKDLEGSQVVFSIGNGLDGWSESVTESVGASAVTVDAGINLRESEESHNEHSEEEAHDDEMHDEESEGHDHDHNDEDGHDEDKEHADGHGHAHGPIDPHYWLSIHNAEQIAMNIAKELGGLDAENASVYTERAEAYATELEALETELSEQVAGLTDTNIISLHDAWNYFANDFGLNIVGTFEPAAGEEPTPQYLATLQEEVEENNVSTLFVEPQLSTASIEAFAGDNNLSLAVIDPLGGVEGRDSYIDLMRYNVQQVVTALSR